MYSSLLGLFDLMKVREIFLVFGLLCRHTARHPITAEMHKSGV